jgi:hypothetical protein
MAIKPSFASAKCPVNAAQISAALHHVITSVEPFPCCASAVQDLRSAAAAVAARSTVEKRPQEIAGHAAAAQAVKGMKTMQVTQAITLCRTFFWINLSAL